MLNKLLGNPYTLLAALLLGLGMGGGAAWHVQGLKLTAVKAEYKGFVAQVEAAGKAAEKEAARVIAAGKEAKQKADDENKVTITQLNADIVRLRNSRTSRGYVPASSASSNRPDLACFNRGELEHAIRQLDDGVSRLLAEGDASALNLNTAKLWALKKP